MNKTTIITTVGIILLILYSLTRILNFYGIEINTYGVYITFYLFLLLSYFVLPTSNHTVFQ